MRQLRIKSSSSIAAAWVLVAGMGFSVVSYADSKTEEIESLRQGIADSKGEISAIADKNQRLHKRMEELKSRLRELKLKLQEQQPVAPTPDN